VPWSSRWLYQNYRIGDEQLAAIIRDSELFKVDGKFDASAYEQYVLSSQYSKTRYEDALRDDQRLQQVVTGLQQVVTGYQESAIVLSDEVRELLEIQAEQRTFDVFSVSKNDYLESVVVDNAEIDEYYQANEDQFLNEEKVSLQFVELNMDQIAETVEVDEDELLAIYEESVESYISEEKRETRHILLNTTGDEDDAAQLSKAQELIGQLAGGADFAELAKENSQDPGSARNGGSLGVVERGQMVPEFDQAAFGLEENQISEPIKTQFGYHIIQVTKIDQPEQQSFEEVRFDLMQEERDRRAEETLLEQVDQLRDLAYEFTDSLDPIAEELGLTVGKTELFDRNVGEGVASSAALRNVAFSEDLLVDDINSEPIEISDGQYVVARKETYQAAEPKPLSEVKEQITALLQEQAAAEAAEQAGLELLERARENWALFASSITSAEDVSSTKTDESDTSETATEENSEVSAESPGIKTFTVALIDNNRQVSPDVLREVTKLSLNNGAPLVSSTAGTNGDFHIIRLTAINPGDVNNISAQIKDSTRRIVAQRNGQSLMASYMESLSESLAPEINTDLL